MPLLRRIWQLLSGRRSRIVETKEEKEKGRTTGPALHTVVPENWYLNLETAYTRSANRHVTNAGDKASAELSASQTHDETLANKGEILGFPASISWRML